MTYATLAVQTQGSGAVRLNDDTITSDLEAVSSPNAGAGSPITVTNSSLEGGIDINCPSSLTVTDNTITSSGRGIESYCNAVGSAVESTVDIANNHVTITAHGGDPAISVAASNLNFTALASNTITAPPESNAVAVDGEVNVSEAMPATPFPWEISGYAVVDVPSGVTLTVKPGAVIKASGGGACPASECSISVEGTLDAAGSVSQPITFTSVNDNTVGGATGSGEPKASEWAGIYLSDSGEIMLDDARISYATDGIDSVSHGKLTIGSSATANKTKFMDNSVALYIAATPAIPGGQSGTNAAIHGVWFDSNGRALDGSSVWNPGFPDPPVPCTYYIPEMEAEGNTYGQGQNPEPFVSASDDTAIELAIAGGADQFPDGWTSDITPWPNSGTPTDTITWQVLACTDDADPQPVVATPFDTG